MSLPTNTPISGVTYNGVEIPLAGGKRLPDAYQEVSFIAGTSKEKNSNYIDTGITFDVNTVVTIGVSWNNDVNTQYDRLCELGSLGWMEGTMPTIAIKFGNHGTSPTIGPLRVEIAVSASEWSLNGTVIQSYSTGTLAENNIYLWTNEIGQYTDSDGRWSIWDVTIEKNGDVVSQLVPCYRISDTEPGMYDTVRKIFLANQGDGSFVFWGTKITDSEALSVMLGGAG